ncbi:CDC27 family protein [Halobacteriovorax sp. HLS]|uniref:tetratricopeptide repeat protein n=1 Tax=Halobacteriovorax sp. HLS TaxID=2234000 RepID=UPI000FD8C989|nr:CDC27 family protein [Halobacteriovorax sp. HLS]
MAQSNQILEKYLMTLEKDPSSRVFAPLAEYYRKNGLLGQAIDTLAQGIKYNPEYVLGHLGLAFCHYDNGEHKKAYDILKPLVDSNRDNIRMLKLFSDICLDLKKYDEALEYLKYLLFVNPKDVDAAEKVQRLEKENAKFGPLKFSFHDDESDEEKEILFDVDSMSSTPEKVSEIDEWVKFDLKQESTDEPEDLNDWSMNTKITLKDQSAEEEVREFKVAERVSKVPEQKKVDSAVITHTLVDLYCNQGYLDKAKSLLEKILELNPTDIKTKLKLQEVERVLSESYFDEDEEDLPIETVKEVTTQQDETNGRNELMNLFDSKFNSAAEEVITNEETIPSHGSDKQVNKLLEDKLWSFHKALSARALEVLSK